MKGNILKKDVSKPAKLLAIIYVLAYFFFSNSTGPRSFEEFKRADMAGRTIDCNKLMQSTRGNNLIAATEIRFGSLTQCKSQIESERVAACALYAQNLKTSYRDKDAWLGDKREEMVCQQEVKEILGEIQDVYSIRLQDQEEVLWIERIDQQIPLKSIKRLTFGKLKPYATVWAISFESHSSEYALMFSDHEKARKSYAELRKALKS